MVGKILILTGGYGFLGTHLYKKLIDSEYNIWRPTHENCDLMQPDAIMPYIKEAKEHAKEVYVIHAAAFVGGIGLNQVQPATMFYRNSMMGIQLIDSCVRESVNKLIIIGTLCSYPKISSFREEDLWNGYPEETNAPYGLAKKMLLVQVQACHEQFGLDYQYLLPTNMYGPNDNFDKTSSHVIPALINKIYEAKRDGVSHITVWGDGSATRDFIYVKDAAELITKAISKEVKLLNIGTGTCYSIKQVVEMLCNIMEYDGKIVWDTSRPNGQPWRQLDTTHMQEHLGDYQFHDFEMGLRETVTWFVDKIQGKYY